MAEQDTGNTDPVASEADAPELGAPEAKASRKMGLALILIPALLLPTAGGAWLVMTQYAQIAQAARSITALLGTTSSSEDEPRTFGQFVQLDGLIVNPAGTEGTRYLMVSLGLEADHEDVLDEIMTKEVVVRDTVLKTLGSRTVQELSDIEMRTLLKTEIRNAINALLTEGEIDRLYFTQYVLQ